MLKSFQVNTDFQPNILTQEDLDKVKASHSTRRIKEDSTQRAELFEDCINLYTDRKGTTDLGKALSLFFRKDKQFAKAAAKVADSRLGNHGDFQRAYEAIHEQSNQRADQLLQPASLSGDNDLSDTLVENTIIKRLYNDNPIQRYIRTKVSTGFAEVKFPRIETDKKATYGAPGIDAFNANDDATGLMADLDNIKVQPWRLAAKMDFVLEEKFMINPQLFAEVIEVMSQLYYNGLYDGMYLGSGTNAPTGMFTNATSVAFSSSITETAGNMLATLAKDKGNPEGTFLLTNEAVAIKMGQEKLLNESFNENISASAYVAKTVMGVDVIVDRRIAFTNATQAPLYAGGINRYLHVKAMEVKTTTGDLDMSKGTLRVVIEGINGGKPVTNNSFAKSTITVF